MVLLEKTEREDDVDPANLRSAEPRFRELQPLRSKKYGPCDPESAETDGSCSGNAGHLSGYDGR